MLGRGFMRRIWFDIGFVWDPGWAYNSEEIGESEQSSEWCSECGRDEIRGMGCGRGRGRGQDLEEAEGRDLHPGLPAGEAGPPRPEPFWLPAPGWPGPPPLGDGVRAAFRKAPAPSPS